MFSFFRSRANFRSNERKKKYLSCLKNIQLPEIYFVIFKNNFPGQIAFFFHLKGSILSLNAPARDSGNGEFVSYFRFHIRLPYASSTALQLPLPVFEKFLNSASTYEIIPKERANIQIIPIHRLVVI